MLLSAALIAKNEAELLPGCLEALSPFVDEICVYDTGSTDNTVKVAKAAGAVVVDGDWPDHWARARNRSVEMCCGEWVLVGNCDEVYRGDPDVFRRTVADAAGEVRLLVEYNPAGTPILSGSRLWRRGCWRFAGCTHEILWPCGDWPYDSYWYERTGTAGGLLITQVRPSSESSRASQEADLAMAEAAVAAGDADPYPGFAELVAAEACAYLGRPDEAGRWLDRAHERIVVPMSRYKSGAIMGGYGMRSMAVRRWREFHAVVTRP
jgi:glycosyltransferase involved in cell wall biosynthesis